MLMTNDGELANKLAHPKFGVEKLYRVIVAGSPERETLNQLTEGIWLAEGKVRAKRVRAVAKKGDATILELVLAEGKNREVRRMLAKLGHKVMMLTRVAVGPITLKGLAAGQVRPLTGKEVDLLRRVAAGEPVPMPWATDRRPLRRRPPRALRRRAVGAGPGDRRPSATTDRRDQPRSFGPRPPTRRSAPASGTRPAARPRLPRRPADRRPPPRPARRLRWPPAADRRPPDAGRTRPAARGMFQAARDDTTTASTTTADPPPAAAPRDPPSGTVLVPSHRADGPQGGPRGGDRARRPPPQRADGPQGGGRGGDRPGGPRPYQRAGWTSRNGRPGGPRPSANRTVAARHRSTRWAPGRRPRTVPARSTSGWPARPYGQSDGGPRAVSTRQDGPPQGDGPRGAIGRGAASTVSAARWTAGGPAAAIGPGWSASVSSGQEGWPAGQRPAQRWPAGTTPVLERSRLAPASSRATTRGDRPRRGTTDRGRLRAVPGGSTANDRRPGPPGGGRRDRRPRPANRPPAPTRSSRAAR